jgi:hypothetical protein
VTDQPRRRRRVPKKELGPARFDATIHPGRGKNDLGQLDDMELDRMPDRYGRVRALVTAEECVRLLDLGYEVRLHRHHPIEPLDTSLIATDESVQHWLDEVLAAARPEGRTKRRRPRKTS